MKNRRNYYRILHVQPDAPQDIIKASYRTLMQKLKMHPDLGGDEWNAILLNEAYAVLSNPGKRASYDNEIRQDPKTAGTHARQNRSDATEDTQKPPRSEPCRHRDDAACVFCGTPKPTGFHYGNSPYCTQCASPLQMVSTLRIVGKRQRALNRIKHNAAMDFFITPTEQSGHRGIIEDLSPKGLRFVSADQLVINQVIKIVCDVLSATARISYCSQGTAGGPYVLGAEFLTLRFHERSGTFISQDA